MKTIQKIGREEEIVEKRSKFDREREREREREEEKGREREFHNQFE